MLKEKTIVLKSDQIFSQDEVQFLTEQAEEHQAFTVTAPPTLDQEIGSVKEFLETLPEEFQAVVTQ